MTRLMSMPIRPGDLLVLRGRAHRDAELGPVHEQQQQPAIIATDVPMIAICTLVIVAPSALPVMW